VASHPTHIPAGGKDKISIVVNTDNRGGQNMRKRFTVTTNDPRHPHMELIVSGKVNAYVRVNPSYVHLMGRQGEKLSVVVRILPEPQYPFVIKSVRAIQGQYVSHTLNPLGKRPQQDGYELVVTNTRREPGTYRDYIQIQTNLKAKPTIRIPVSGRVFENDGGSPVSKPQ
jgi:hypothetical protein